MCASSYSITGDLLVQGDGNKEVEGRLITMLVGELLLVLLKILGLPDLDMHSINQ